MKVSLVNVQAPFIWGGAEYLAESLQVELEERGHQVETIRIPFKWYPPEAIVDHMLACRLMRTDANEPDLVIGMKFPAYLAPSAFPKKIWLIHQFRQAYDLWGTPYQGIPDTPDGLRIRDMIRRADGQHLREAREIYTISRNVADRLNTYNGIVANDVLYPPLRHPERYRVGVSGDYFFYPSRLLESKRQELAIEAMRHVRSSFRLVLAGTPDTPEYGERLQRLVRRHGLEDRVVFAGFVSEERKVELLADCRAVLNLPYDEDYGFVSLEALHASKPVISCTDGGGALELIEHDRSGLAVAPDPRALAEAMERLWAEGQRAVEMGHEAQRSLDRLQITWDFVVERLLA